jgi:hypothetical protein
MGHTEGVNHGLLYLQPGLSTSRPEFAVGVMTYPANVPPPVPGYGWTVAVPVQIYFALLTAVAVPYFIWRLLIRFGWVTPSAAKMRFHRWLLATQDLAHSQRHLAPAATRTLPVRIYEA